MVANYLKIALRHLNRHRGYSLINIFGLAVGITSCLLIMIFVRSEWSYDSFHSNAKNLYRLWQREKADSREFLNTVTPIPTGPAIHAYIPDLQDNIRMLTRVWDQVAPGQNFEYKFLDESLAAAYQQEQRSETVIKLAAALSVFIACMGLFGLATLMVVRRTKEIGIRKVLGASVFHIVQMLSVDFVLLIVVATLIAVPISWLAMTKWLDDFAFKVSLSWWIFFDAGIAAHLIALMTIAYNAVRAALANPVRTLKTNE